MFRTSIVAALAAGFFCAGAQASTLSLVDLAAAEGAEKIFNIEVKRDQNLGNGAQRGHDVFLRPGSETTGASTNVAWGASGTTYDWLLSLGAGIATLTAAGQTVTSSIGAGTVWNAFSFTVKALWDQGGVLVADLATGFSVDAVNGTALHAPLVFLAENDRIGTPAGFAFALEGLSGITSLGGTFSFAFENFASNAGSPNSRLGFDLKGWEVAAIPLPAAGWLLLAGLGALGVAGRRRTRTA